MAASDYYTAVETGRIQANSMANAGAVGRSVAKHGIMGHLFPGLRKQEAPAAAYDEADGHAGIKAEALKELARYNPSHPLLNQAYRKRLFAKYASGKLEVPLIGEHPFAKDPDAK